MQQSIPSHPSSQEWWNPPTHIAKRIIKHALRNIPNHEILMDKCYPKAQNPNHQLPQHKYSSGGKLQWAFG